MLTGWTVTATNNRRERISEPRLFSWWLGVSKSPPAYSSTAKDIRTEWYSYQIVSMGLWIFRSNHCKTWGIVYLSQFAMPEAEVLKTYIMIQYLPWIRNGGSTKSSSLRHYVSLGVAWRELAFGVLTWWDCFVSIVQLWLERAWYSRPVLLYRSVYYDRL